MSSEINIMGAYFPGWLLSSLIGIVLAALSKIVLAKVGLHKVLVLPMLVYLSLAFLWSGLVWIVLFD